LKYSAKMNIVSETAGKTKDGADIVLSNILTVSTLVQQAGAIGDITLGLAFGGENSVAYESKAAFKSANVIRDGGQLLPGDEHYVIVKVDMAETVGNEANHDGVNAPAINFGINVLAAQFTYESDSFGNQYDKDAFAADYYVTNADALAEAMQNAEKDDIVALMDDVEKTSTESNAYGKTGLSINNGQIFDGNGNTFGVPTATGTWDSAINITGGTIRNVTVNSGFRGIFINHNSTYSAPVILENVVIDGPVYTISCDQGTNQGLTATGCTFNGWTSYAATLGNTTFVDCSFGEGSGYAFCRPYAPTSFVNCNFEAGYEIDARAAVTLENCYLDGVLITADNVATLVTGNTQNAIVK
ncbi:MAG: hypothetical protein IKT56_01050, partial [Clostridia bacterium]|nr:hypothetical protein [Clostridia bacterium]